MKSTLREEQQWERGSNWKQLQCAIIDAQSTMERHSKYSTVCETISFNDRRQTYKKILNHGQKKK